MPAGIITTGSHPKALWPGVHEFWSQVYDAYEKKYPMLYDQDTSEKAYEEDVQITGFGLAPIKPQGQPLTFDSEVQGPVTRYTHIAYALGFIVTYEEKKFNLYEQVAMRRAKANAFSMNQTVENVAAFIYNNAFSSTFFATGDGVSLVNTAHVNTTGGTYSNELSPSADLSETALENICIQIMGAQTDRGLVFALMPESLHIPKAEWFNANRILKSVMQSNTVSNNVNVLKLVNAFPKGINMNPFFSNASYWFVRTNCPNGMTMFWVEEPNFDQDNDFDTKNAKASSYMMLSVGCTDPHGIYASQ